LGSDTSRSHALVQVGDSDKLGATKKYDRKEVGSKPSAWVTRLVAQVDQFDAKVRPQRLSCRPELLWATYARGASGRVCVSHQRRPVVRID
jgi:hypothetical protein